MPTIKTFVHSPPPNWANELVVIGHSLIDLYLGEMSVEQIEDEILQQLRLLNIHHSVDYETWLESARGYQLIRLSDSSVWTLRRSKANDFQYIHIHPARYSPLTIRIKSETLKTAIAYHCLKHYQPAACNVFSPHITKIGYTETLNFVRQTIGLSPIKIAERRGKMHWLIHILGQD